MDDRTTQLLIGAGLALSAAGCSEKSTLLGTAYIEQQLVRASKGGSLAVVMEDCASNSAYCPYVGTSVVIPRGTLSQDTKITIGVGIDRADRKMAGPALDLGPSGTTFSSPIEVTLPLTRNVDEHLLRIYVTQADGTKNVLLPHQIDYDAATHQARFFVSHFTMFQCGEADDPCDDVNGCPSGICENGRCSDACDPSADCGPPPGLPSWTCDDGTAGGMTGECARRADGSCGWVVRDCPDVCTAICAPDGNGQCDPKCKDTCNGQNCPDGSRCDPATGMCTNECVCPDGQPCSIGDDGTISCNGQGCGPDSCPPGSTCDPATGACVGGCVCPDGQACEPTSSGTRGCDNICGPNSCPPGTTCDPAIGACVGGCVCPDGQACRRASDGSISCDICGPNSCPPGSTCDPTTGACMGGCVCPDGQPCDASGGAVRCNGVCDPTFCPLGSTCDPVTGACVGGDCVCPDGQPCERSPDGTVTCDNLCGPNDCPPGSTCDPATGNCVSDCRCANGQPCATDPTGSVSCGANECSFDECGPPPGVPSWVCDDGTPGGSTGRCLRNADGTCGWEIVWCPMGCGPNACSGAPPPPDRNEPCTDGTVAPYVCRRDSSGNCAWAPESCQP